MDNNKVFALDIGTRSVTGVILEQINERFTVVDFCMEEHKERSMLDGQIHDVVEVSEVIRKVKEKMEKNNGPLHKVCVAAAGRALKTIHASATIQLHQQPIMEQETIKHLELTAVQAAQVKLAEKENSQNYSNYYCVGYSILNYMLDDQAIGSLIDQNGERASVNIIATFLPKVVVESLLAALSRADLSMDALTLEPIAAIQVLIPESMRRLNVALIDIGAGTSDIALTNKGTISAYGMVPIAGDEITEAISDHYLLDFPMAEQTKRKIVIEGQDVVSDILGFETVITYEELANEIMDSVHTLASSLAAEVLRLNKQSPKAVMLIGGGSMTPEITKVLANQLQLPENRVAVRGIEAIQNLNKSDKLPSGPDFITPIGIAIAAKQNPVHYISVKVNDMMVRMFEMKQLTIGDCLVQAGIEINKLYGKPGLAAMVTIDGRDITLPGTYGQPPTIRLNDENSSVESLIYDGDEIIIERGEHGTPSIVTLREVIGELPKIIVYFNGQKHELGPSFYVNGQLKTDDYIVQDKDDIFIKQVQSIADFFTSLKMDDITETSPFFVEVNHEQVSLPKAQTKILVNEREVSRDYVLKDLDNITVVASVDPTVEDLLAVLDKHYWSTIEVYFNNEKFKLKQQQLSIQKDGLELKLDTKLTTNDQINITHKKVSPFIFQDIFRYVDIDLTKVKGHFNIYKNNKPTTFHDDIVHGDQLRIEWE